MIHYISYKNAGRKKKKGILYYTFGNFIVVPFIFRKISYEEDPFFLLVNR